MRLYAPLYEGDSFLRPDSAIGAPVRRNPKAPAATPDFVRSNTQTEAARLTSLEIQALVQTANRMRSDELGRLIHSAYVSLANGLKSASTAISNWLERVEYQERDNFFAAASNLSDLEQRQRHYERTGQTHY